MTKTTKMTQLLKQDAQFRAFYNEVLWYAKFSLTDMPYDTLIKAKEVCGCVCWDALGDNWNRRLAGSCFAHMVSTNQLPLVFVQYKKSRTKHYLLK